MIKVFPRFPGLSLRPQFISSVEEGDLWGRGVVILNHVKKLCQFSADHHHHQQQQQIVTNSPDLDPQREECKIVSFEREDRRKISCKHFDSFGNANTSLTSFRGESNFPCFVSSFIGSKLLLLPEVQDLATKKGKTLENLEWKWTMKHYRGSVNEIFTQKHQKRELDVHGDITIVISLGCLAALELIKHEEQISAIKNDKEEELIVQLPRSLLLLNNKEGFEASNDKQQCYDCFHHRVIGQERLSYVFGCR